MLAGHGELVDEVPVPDAAGEPVQQLVHADVTFRCQPRDGLREVLRVVILHGRTIISGFCRRAVQRTTTTTSGDGKAALPRAVPTYPLWPASLSSRAPID